MFFLHSLCIHRNTHFIHMQMMITNVSKMQMRRQKDTVIGDQSVRQTPIAHWIYSNSLLERNLDHICIIWQHAILKIARTYASWERGEIEGKWSIAFSIRYCYVLCPNITHGRRFSACIGATREMSSFEIKWRARKMNENGRKTREKEGNFTRETFLKVQKGTSQWRKNS